MRKTAANTCFALILSICLVFSNLLLAQTSADSLSSKSITSYIKIVEKKVSQTDEHISNLTEKTIRKLEKQEQKLYKKLYKIDSIAANNIFSKSVNHYQQVQENVKGNVQKVGKAFSGDYIPYLDTLTNSVAFLKEGKELVNKSKELKDKVNEVSSKVSAFNNKVQQTEDIKKYIRERKEYLKQQLSRYTSLNKDLMKLNKTVFYYSQQVKEVKEALKDPKKAEQKVLALLRESKLFQDFIQKNSFLAGLFETPSNYATTGVGNLQTRGQIDQFIQTRMSTMGPNAQQQIQQNIQVGQQQLQRLKAKFPYVNNLGDMPEFEPNMEKTKQFKKRLELGSNFQTTKARTYFPTTTDIAVSLGYKLNEKSVVGVGSSIKMGWGTGFDNIRITQQGLSLRSFLDWKLKGSFWITGGYEQNYLTAFRRIEELKNKAVWKQSALIGMSKVISVKSNFFKKTKVQILYDFLWKQQVPVTQPVLFRMGYNF
ncbi:MAG: hypothetical protein K2Q24_08910 [Chitinophagaceae bacterium]|jgi:hypothetical protein|nr:hypothetical protein [Chitinophagaceae bacterium]